MASTVVVAAVLHAGVVLLSLAVGYLAYGRERRVPRAVVEERPNDMSPAEVATLDDQGRVTSRAWVATLIDLMSREVVLAGTVVGGNDDAVDDEGPGIHRVDGARTLRPHERALARVIAAVVDAGPVARDAFAERVRRLGEAGEREGREFSLMVRNRLHDRGLTIVDGAAFAWTVLSVATIVAVATLLIADTLTEGGVARVKSIAYGIGIGTLVGAVGASVVGHWPGLWVGRSERGGRTAARWRAYGASLEQSKVSFTAQQANARVPAPDLAYAVALGAAPEVEQVWAGCVPPGLGRPRRAGGS